MLLKNKVDFLFLWIHLNLKTYDSYERILMLFCFITYKMRIKGRVSNYYTSRVISRKWESIGIDSRLAGMTGCGLEAFNFWLLIRIKAYFINASFSFF